MSKKRVAAILGYRERLAEVCMNASYDGGRGLSQTLMEFRDPT